MSRIVWRRGRDMVWVGCCKGVSGDAWTVTEDGWSYVLRRNDRKIGRYSNARKAKLAAEAMGSR